MGNTVGQSFTVAYHGLTNVLKVDVQITPNLVDLCNIKSNNWVSLWDTGATKTVITKRVVDALNLKPVSMGTARTPQGQYDAYLYYIDLYLPNKVHFPKLLVMEGQPADCDILIGMDVIGSGDFAVSNYEKQTTFTYRYPSCSKLDFVEHSYIEPIVKKDSPTAPARNSKCPCGSGKKYKNCCGRK